MNNLNSFTGNEWIFRLLDGVYLTYVSKSASNVKNCVVIIIDGVELSLMNRAMISNIKTVLIGEKDFNLRMKYSGHKRKES